MAAGHVGFVLATLFDVDGLRLYSASIDGRVHLWDVANGNLLSGWSCHDGPILALRRSADGARLFTASHDGSIGIWDARDGRLERRLTGHRGGVHGLAVSAHHLASGGYDGTIRLWDAESGAPLAMLSEHAEAVTSLAFLAPDRLVSGSRDSSIRLWDLKRGASERVLRGHRHWVTRLAALPDGRRVLSAGEDGLCILWDCERGEIVWSADAGGPLWGFALAPDGERAVTGGAAPTLCWNVRSGDSRRIDLRPTSARGRSSVRFAERSAAISPDGTWVAGGNSDSGIVIYDLDRDEVIQRIDGASGACLSAAVVGEHLATGHGDGSIVLHGSGELRRLDAHAFMAYALCRVGSDRLASGGFDRAVCVWDLVRGEPLARFDHGGFVFSVVASVDGSRLLSAGEDAVCIWDAASQRRVLRIDAIGSGFHTVADLAPDGAFVAAGEDDQLRVYRADGTLAAKHALPRASISAVRLLPDGRCVAVAEGGGGVRLLDLETGSLELLHEAHEDWIRRVHVTPDGRHVVSDSQNGICRIYSLPERRLLEIGALRRPIAASALAADGAVVALTPLGEVVRVAL